jgi:abequosyltransferase
MTSKVRLSFCIATLNRARFLAETLDSLMAQSTPEVEVVIVDGASTDDTSQVVEAARRQFPAIQYRRLPEKGGVDRDYCRAVEMARGDYCWLFSDDDVLTPGAVAAVLDAIGLGPGLVIVNAECRTPDLSKVVEARRLPMAASRLYLPADSAAFFTKAADFMSFIGCVVIRRDVWMDRDRESYVGTSFIHLGVVFQRPIDFPVQVIAEPLIAIRLGNAEWSSRAFEIWMFKWPALIWSFTHFSEAERGKVVRQEPWRKSSALLRYRSRGAYSLDTYNRWLRQRLTGRQRLTAFLVAMVPDCWANIIGLMYYSFVRYSLIELIDLRASRTYYRKCIARPFERFRGSIVKP